MKNYFGNKDDEKKSPLNTIGDALGDLGNTVKNIVSPSGQPANSDLVDKIQLNNINQVYYNKDGSENVIFNDFSMQIKDVKDAGQFVVLVGASGCGKSTLLRYISGLQKPTSGEIILNGKPQTDKDRVGMVFQQYTSLPWSTVINNVALPLELKGVSRDERLDRAYEMLKLVGLEDHADKYAQYGILSGGQLQRVAIARNLVAGAEMLFLDEPFGALDISTRLEMQDLLCNVWTKIAVTQDPTFLMVTHDLSEAVYLADEIYIMSANPGKVVEKLRIDLPLDRDKLIKRTKKFSDYVYYLEDVMMGLNK